MTMRTLLPVLLTLLVACTTAEQTREVSPNRWSDERLWPVLEAQEHRDTQTLCAQLGDSSASVREAAALAFASVQDSASVGCLLKALTDPVAGVRSTAIFALGFIADSLVVQRMAEVAVNERDTIVQRAFLSASFLAMQRNGMLKDPNAILYYLDSGIGHERARAADVLRRLPDSTLSLIVDEIRDRIPAHSADVRQFLVLGLAKAVDQRQWPYLERSMVLDQDRGVRVNALRALARVENPGIDTLLLAMTAVPPLEIAALEILEGREMLPVRACLDPILPGMDQGVRIRLLGLALDHAGEELADSIRLVLQSVTASGNSPYHRAAAIRALANAPEPGYKDELLSLMQSDAPSIVRQAAFEGLVGITKAIMERSRYASAQDQYDQLGNVVKLAIRTSDPGLICAAAELLREEEPGTIRLLLPASMDENAIASLHTLRDMEAVQLLQQAIAKRNGLTPPANTAPAFNHPIAPAKLRTLPQGQRYRITTAKGNIILATDVNECPGSSLAFDSLVTAGYYNGKAFHRMVPNFVAQGGCPRGDGYGGMPWTLRTEIGRKLFTAGSVGLASAGRDTESCQFFITHSATPHLDGRYTRFGVVVEGMDIVWQLQVGDVMDKVERVK
jgi:cyclophilin family peptidyl-prolyl cis-trans isomerase/HEAT repeat protein